MFETFLTFKKNPFVKSLTLFKNPAAALIPPPALEESEVDKVEVEVVLDFFPTDEGAAVDSVSTLPSLQ